MKKNHHHSKHKHVEHQLLSRLQILGWLLILFGCGTFAYSLMLPSEENNSPIYAIDTEEIESSGPSLEPAPKLKLEIVYLGVSTFWIIGTACVIFAWRRKKRLVT